METSLADRIDSILPQTQCGRCGYERCRPYAEALAAGSAPINRCPPGGHATIETLARLLSRPAIALDPQCGVPGPFSVAKIEESDCIGCMLCIQACPVDAIVGAAKCMHTVVAELCTGCERCLAPCPVDCILMAEPSPARPWLREDADRARERMLARDRRLAREREAAAQRLERHRDESSEAPVDVDLDAAMPVAVQASGGLEAMVARALAGARRRRADPPR